MLRSRFDVWSRVCSPPASAGARASAPTRGSSVVPRRSSGHDRTRLEFVLCPHKDHANNRFALFTSTHLQQITIENSKLTRPDAHAHRSMPKCRLENDARARLVIAEELVLPQNAKARDTTTAQHEHHGEDDATVCPFCARLSFLFNVLVVRKAHRGRRLLQDVCMKWHNCVPIRLVLRKLAEAAIHKRVQSRKSFVCRLEQLVRNQHTVTQLLVV